MKRRDFLKTLSAGSLGMMLGQGLSMRLAHAAGSVDPTKKFVFIYFSGAWDVLLGLDPRDPDSFTEERVEETGIQPAWHLIEADNPGFPLGLVQADGVPYIVGPAMAAMAPHFDVCSVVRGIAMDTVTHEVGRRYFLTGMMPRGLNAAGSSMGTRIVAQQGDRTPIPNLVCRSESYNEGLPNFASALSVASVTDLVAALADGPAAPSASGAVRQALSNFRGQENAFCDPSAFNRFGMLESVRTSAVKARDLVEGTGQGLAMADLFNFRLTEHDALRLRYGDFPRFDLGHDGARMAMAYQALKHGIAQSVSLTAARGLDTHDDNWATDHPDLQKGGWDLVAALLADLKTTPDPDVVGKKLIDTTTVVCFSEFSRTPKLNNRDGRDHAIVNACLLAGGGVPKNKLFGATSEIGMNALPIDPQTGQFSVSGVTLTPNNILASVLANAGLDTDKLRHDGLPFLRV